MTRVPRRRARVWPVIVSAATACAPAACGRSQPDARGTAAPSAAPAGPEAGATGAAASGSGAAPTHGPVEWRGTYKSAAAGLYIPPDWKNVRFTDKDTTAGIGEGAIAFRVDGDGGRVVGTIDGPIGPATLDGVASGGKLTATIRRKDPSDQGFTGTLIGAIADGKADGTLSVSRADGSVIRSATFGAAPERAAR